MEFQLWKEVRGFAAYLWSAGLTKGDHVVVKAKHAIWYVVACFGTHLAGCVFVPLEKTLGRDGLLERAQQIGPKLLIADMDIQTNEYRTVLSPSVRALAEEYFDDMVPFSFPSPGDISDILFTTGATGKSKGVVLSHRAEVAVAENMQYGLEIPKNNAYWVYAKNLG